MWTASEDWLEVLGNASQSSASMPADAERGAGEQNVVDVDLRSPERAGDPQ
jgi:hypothetical protein